VILRGAPTRGSSYKPSSRRSAKRLRHFPAVTLLHRTFAATATSDRPDALASTIRARVATLRLERGRRLSRSSSSRSSDESSISVFGRPIGTVDQTKTVFSRTFETGD